MSKQPTPIRRGDLDEVYDADESSRLLRTMATAIKNGDSKVFINLSTVLATIFGVLVLAVGGRVFLNAVALSEVKILLETSSAAQTEFRAQANTRFQSLEGSWKREAEMMRKNIDKLEADINAMGYRISRAEDTHASKPKKAE